MNNLLARTKMVASFLLVCIMLSLFAMPATPAEAQAFGGRTPGMVAAFYYPWYDPRDPDFWNPAKMSSLPATKYNSGDLNYVKGQMEQAKNSGIDAFAVTWDAPTGDWSNRFKAMFDNAPAGFTIAAHYEVTLADKSLAGTINNLKFIRDTYTNSPKYMHYQGKPVIFFWRPTEVEGAGGANVNNVWRNIRSQVDPNNQMIWSTDGVDVNLLQAFDSLHLFSAAKEQNDPAGTYRNFRTRIDQFNAANGTRKLWTAGVTPGYDDRKFRSPGEFRDREGTEYYKRSWAAAIGSSPNLVTISTWNEWFEGSAIEPGEVWGDQFVKLTKDYATQYKGTTGGFGDSSISKVWNRTDLQVASGAVKRSWLWGPLNDVATREPYAEGPGGSRLVYYFDKARMEITRVNGDPEGQFYVTNGLLVREMMRGKIQTGDNAEQDKGAANVTVAGDANNNAQCPTYASMAGVASLADDKKAPNRVGQAVTEKMTANGQVSTDNVLGSYGVTYAYFEPTLAHNIAKPFWDFFNQTGPIIENGVATNGRVIDWVSAMGFPVTEAYWAKVRVDNVERDVLIQAFERRVMTFDPSNPDGFKVEMGNVGDQYYSWRYGK